MALDPAQGAQKWVTNTSAAGPSITAGVNAVTEAPGAKAVQNQAGYLAGVQQNVDKWARKTGAVTLAQWKQDMLNKGLPRIAGGVQAAQSRYQQAITPLYGYINSGLGQLDAQAPRGSLQQNINRMVAWANYMSNYQGTP